MSPTPVSPQVIPVPLWVQLFAWSLGLAACVEGLQGLIAQWDGDIATVQLVIMLLVPVVWLIQVRPKPADTRGSHRLSHHRSAWVLAILVGLTSWATCYLVGRGMTDLPPAYHDEYSYVFQAKTLLGGGFSIPSHPTHPELFDQMHVLNEGRMASRYYPGTGIWLAPFVAWGHPYWGDWLATSLASVFVFWTGYELGRLRTAIISGFSCALSPGIALFGNLLLAHQPTLLGLTFFLWAFVKWRRTFASRDAFLAGCGLAAAMLCRPATAAGFGLPFGIEFLICVLFSRTAVPLISRAWRFRTLLAMGLPLIAGWGLMAAYNNDVTGSWRTSPYQLYTDLYSPRHVYGFNNGIRGDQKQGPKVIQAYDRWAENLTPQLAATNVFNRWLASWLWTFDLLPQLISVVVVLALFFRIDRRWRSILFAILSLHAIHIPYWYVGIMGWHYVFETAPLLCLVLGLATDLLVNDWRSRGRQLVSYWWYFLLTISVLGNFFPWKAYLPDSDLPRVAAGIGSIQYPRSQYAEVENLFQSLIKMRPALVLIEIDPNDQHVDYVVNSPDWNAPILRARYQPGRTDLKAVERDFPDRALYLYHPSRKTLTLLKALDRFTGR